MTLNRYLLATGFSYARMLEMPPEQARQYFILNYFVPLGYEVISSMNEEAAAVLVLSAREAFEGKAVAKPVIVKVIGNLDATVWSDTLIAGEPVAAQHFERISGTKLDLVEQDKALNHAFGAIPSSASMSDVPVVASLQNIAHGPGRKILLNVLFVKKRHAAWQTHSVHSGTTRASSLAAAGATFGYRAYNRKTGEWIGLCNPADPACCEACQKIYRSKASNSYFDA